MTNGMTRPEHLTRLESQLLEILGSYESVAVAFSGGVDSAVVAAAAWRTCGQRAVAITAVSPSLASGELETAREVARQIGIPHRVIETSEFAQEGYIANAGDRCYFCKSELYTQIATLLPTLGMSTICNGANLDDQGDYRPGMRAAQEFEVRSPLMEAGFRKSDVRALAEAWGLPVWDKPATPCLSSRIAYGVEVTPERVARVDAAEQFLRSELGIEELRVRHEAHDLARIELPVEHLGLLSEADRRERINSELRNLGFQYVTLDLDGFRSGSMNRVLPTVRLDVSHTPK